MFNPSKRLGEDDGPAAVIAIGHPKPMPSKFNPSKRIGETSDDTQEDQGGDPDQMMTDLAERLCKALNVGSDRAPRIKDLLEAFCHAADSKPHAEGEDTSDAEEKDEGN